MKIEIKSRVLWLDSLRGIAATIVLIAHLMESILKQNVFKPENELMFTHLSTIFGKIGVVTFFIVSGYVIPYSLKKSNLKDFAISRIFRLYPAYWFSLIILLLIISPPPAPIILANFTMFQKFVGIEDLNGVYWTLQMEITFYFMCAALKYFDILFNQAIIRKVILSLGVISLTGALIRFYLHKNLPVGLFLNTQIMFFGLYLRLNFDSLSSGLSPHLFNKNIIKQIVLILFLFIPTCYFAYGENIEGDILFNYDFLIGYALAFIVFLLFFKFEFDMKPLIFLGTISYSLYLLHGLAMLVFIEHDFFKSNNLLWSVPVYLLVAILLSCFSYYIIEKYSYKLKFKFKKV